MRNSTARWIDIEEDAEDSAAARMCAAVPSLVPEPPDSPHSDDAARRGLCLVPASPVPEGAVYETTVLPHAAFLHARALGMTRNREEAEDLVQDTLLKALKHFRQFRPGTNSRAWLVRILKNTFISGWRGRGGREPRVMTPLEDAPELIAVSTVSDPVDPEKALAQREGAVAVEKVFAAIPERYRSALRLHFLGLSYREIAERLDVPMGTVMSRLHRARRHATRVLRESGEKLGLGADLAVRA